MKRWLGLLTSAAVLLVTTSAAHAANGSWSVVASPSPSTSENGLSRVACTSKTNCWATGTYEASSPDQAEPYIVHWNGAAWSLETSPVIAGDLNAVSCASKASCYAVGQQGASTPTPLIEHWNGTSWSVVSGAIPSNVTGDLGAISCPTGTTECWAVGTLQTSSSGSTIPLYDAFELKAKKWVEVNDTMEYGGSVACTTAKSCWLVGSGDIQGGTANTVRWNGSQWQPQVGAVSENFYPVGVNCLKASDCWVVGEQPAVDNTFVPASERWNGSDWTVVPAADSNTAPSSDLISSACESASVCWSVGVSYNQFPPTNPVNEKLTSSGWALDATAPVTTNGGLDSTTCFKTECWAVGYVYTSYPSTDTLIEQRTN